MGKTPLDSDKFDPPLLGKWWTFMNFPKIGTNKTLQLFSGSHERNKQNKTNCLDNQSTFVSLITKYKSHFKKLTRHVLILLYVSGQKKNFSSPPHQEPLILKLEFWNAQKTIRNRRGNFRRWLGTSNLGNFCFELNFWGFLCLRFKTSYLFEKSLGFLPTSNILLMTA